MRIESEEDFKAVIEKIPDYRIKPERVSEGETHYFRLSQRLITAIKLFVEDRS